MGQEPERRANRVWTKNTKRETKGRGQRGQNGRIIGESSWSKGHCGLGKFRLGTGVSEALKGHRYLCY